MFQLSKSFHFFPQYFDAAAFEPTLPMSDGQSDQPVLFPHCKFGEGKSSKACQTKRQDVPTAAGTCHTINADGEFGLIGKVGDSRGLSVVVDMQNFESNARIYGTENRGELKVCTKLM